MYQKSYDPEKNTGDILVNISLDISCYQYTNKHMYI